MDDGGRVGGVVAADGEVLTSCAGRLFHPCLVPGTLHRPERPEPPTMAVEDPDLTVPRVPTPAPEQTADHIAADDTSARVADESSADPDRTAARPPSGTPAAGSTVVRTPSDVARLEESAQTQAEEGIPGYVLLGELGRGGMGVVHKARHVKLNRAVALKMMLGGGQASRGDLIRFLAEAEAVAAIKHENVVQVFDYGETDGRPYMALEFCPGGTLGKLLPKDRDAARAPREMAALVAQVARGVAAAHALGIVHRDLKPGNVFLDDAGVPKVADFGLAKRGEGSDVTREGVGMGTPAYMAPEQARDAKFVGPQADVWALGVILYEALTGTRPFTGTVQEIMAKAQNSEPLPPRKVIGSLPRDLELICLKCLSKAPHERYATAKELADDLDRYARGEPISVRPAGPLERGYKWVKRNKVVSGALATVTLALLVGAGVSLGFGLEAQRQKKEADDATVREQKEKQDAIDARNEVKGKNDELLRSREQINRTLAKALLGPITANNRDKPLTPYEVETFWQLAELRRDEVSWMFLEEATRTALACEQLECRAEYAFHATLGLDLARRKTADQLFLSRLSEPNTPGSKAVSLAMGVSRSDFASTGTASTVARILTDALAKEMNALVRAQLAIGLAGVVAWTDPTEAAKVCLQAARILTDALAKEMNALARVQLAIGLAAVATRMDPTEAAKVCSQAAYILAKALVEETAK